MRCIKCGKNIRENSKFCIFCGASIENSKVKEEERRGRPKIILGALCLSAIILAIILLFIYHNANKPSNLFLHQLDDFKINITNQEVQGGNNDTAKLETYIIKNVTYEVVEKQDSAVTLKISAPNMADLLFYQDEFLLERPDGIKDILFKLENGEYELLENEVTLQLAEDGTPMDSDILIDYLYGNLFSQIEKGIMMCQGGEPK